MRDPTHVNAPDDLHILAAPNTPATGESDETWDDSDLEVTDLRTGQHSRLRLDLSPGSGLLDYHARLRALLARLSLAATGRSSLTTSARFTLNRARTTWAAIFVVLLAAMIAVVGSTPGVATALAALVHLPFPGHSIAISDTAPPGESGFVAVDGVPWGTLLLDGKFDSRANTHMDAVLQGSFTLTPGRHALEYHAAPFPTMTCVVTVPADPTDTCPLAAPGQAAAMAGPFPPSVRVLDLRATPDHLPREQQAALVTAIRTALAVRAPVEPATVLAGEPYVAADGNIAHAARPLKATFLFDFQWSPSRGLTDCSSLCVRQRSVPPYYDVWIVVAHIHQGWRYTAPSGTTLISSAPPVANVIAPAAPTGTAADIYINLYVRWTGWWQVSTLSLAEFGDPYAVPTCAVGFDTLLRLLGGGNVAYTPVPAPHVADGCIFVVRQLSANGAPSGQPLVYFFRFGVLLALNAGAHTLIAALPTATTPELALARQILTQAGQPSP